MLKSKSNTGKVRDLIRDSTEAPNCGHVTQNVALMLLISHAAKRASPNNDAGLRKLLLKPSTLRCIVGVIPGSELWIIYAFHPLLGASLDQVAGVANSFGADEEDEEVGAERKMKLSLLVQRWKPDQ
ncbi:hypothetical protein L3X38_034650 [Prunus dulcis]|uniref:Uncharacterized protein n=1 Tax=Prunus dulcis TaxID=3755 RepID=A0AAD4VKG9_PRUDU|nr:hypothetical protein L3X38_034650 [Prunus dulcis]